MCKWHPLVAKFVINASGAIWWSNLQQVVEKSVGKSTRKLMEKLVEIFLEKSMEKSVEKSVCLCHLWRKPDTVLFLMYGMWVVILKPECGCLLIIGLQPE